MTINLAEIIVTESIGERLNDMLDASLCGDAWTVQELVNLLGA